MPNILVTGGNGSLGKRLVPLFRAKGYEVTVLLRKDADITDRAALERALSAIDFDTVLHLAAVTHSHHSSEYVRVNVDGTKNLIEICKAKNARMIFMSSRAASKNGGAYAESKLAAENAVKESGLNYVILQPAEVYGGAREAIPALISYMRKFHVAPILGSGEYKVTPVWIEDVLPAIVNAIALPREICKSYILAGPEEFTYNELVARIARTRSVRALPMHVPIPAVRALALLARAVGSHIMVNDQIDRLMVPKSADISAARADLAFYPISFAEGIQKSYEL